MNVRVGPTSEVHPFSREAVDALIANDIVAVRLPDFASEPEIDAFTAALLDDPVRTNSIASVTRLGISQFEQGIRGSKREYFSMARELVPGFALVAERSFSPIERFMSALADLGYDVAVMTEPGFGLYWAGNGKLRNGTTPVHVDFSPQDSAGWKVGEVAAQLAWNLYLECEPEDEVLIWDKQWSPADDVHLVEGEYFYRAAVIENAELTRIPPVRGEVLILNSRSFHSVAECQQRLTFGSFIGVLGADTLRLWS